jgi:biopolymer transport protein ExbD
VSLELETGEGDSPGVDITPMIDIVFQLILFLLIATSMTDEMSREREKIEEQKIALDLPQSGAGRKTDEKPETLIVNVQEDGAYIVRGQSLTRRSLRELLTQVAAENPRTAISIRGHRNTALQHVVDVMGECNTANLRNLDIRVESAAPRGARGEDPLDLGGGR